MAPARSVGTGMGFEMAFELLQGMTRSNVSVLRR